MTDLYYFLFFLFSGIGLDIVRRKAEFPFVFILLIIETIIWIIFFMTCLICLYTVPEYFRKKKLIGNGTITGYKKLVNYNGHWCSPQRGTRWVGNCVISDCVPTPDNTNGIYITKSRYHPDLDDYDGVVVRVLGEGQYIEHEEGYRVHKARIIGIV